MAAFELASMAATSDDNKFLIVAENGLDSLISLSLTEALGTQEYAAEALAELLTVPQIQVSRGLSSQSNSYGFWELSS